VADAAPVVGRLIAHTCESSAEVTGRHSAVDMQLKSSFSSPDISNSSHLSRHRQIPLAAGSKASA
jgi:hypothetical protein